MGIFITGHVKSNQAELYSGSRQKSRKQSIVERFLAGSRVIAPESAGWKNVSSSGRLSESQWLDR
jgi:hypothetical protein